MLSTLTRALTPIFCLGLTLTLFSCGGSSGDNGPKVIQGSAGLFQAFNLTPDSSFVKENAAQHFFVNIPAGSDAMVIQARTLDGGVIELRAGNPANPSDPMAYDFIVANSSAQASLNFDPSSYGTQIRVVVYMPSGATGPNRCEVLALVSSSGGAQPDMVEPNDDLMTAVEIGPGPNGFANLIGLTITSGDVDWYSFGITDNLVILDGNFLCRINIPTSTMANLQVELFEDVDGTEMGLIPLGSTMSMGSANGIDFADLIISGDDLVPTKLYFVKVSGAGGSAPYFLRFY